MTLAIRWLGTDGSQWDLRSGPVKLSDAGIKGLGMPIFLPQVRTSAAADGQVLTDFKAGPRGVNLPVRFRTSDLEVHADFWQSVSPYQGSVGTGTLVVTRNGVDRALRLRFEDDGGNLLRQDPEFVLNDVWNLGLVADDPWWYGQDVKIGSSQLDTYTPQFFGDGAGAPLFYISDNLSGGGGVIQNPGDVPAWPRWIAEGELTGWQAVVNSHPINALGIAVGVGSVMTLDSDPLSQLAVLDGVVVNFRLYQFDAYALPPGEPASVSIQTAGPGRVTGYITPRYLRGY